MAAVQPRVQEVAVAPLVWVKVPVATVLLGTVLFLQGEVLVWPWASLPIAQRVVI